MKILLIIYHDNDHMFIKNVAFVFFYIQQEDNIIHVFHLQQYAIYRIMRVSTRISLKVLPKLWRVIIRQRPRADSP